MKNLFIYLLLICVPVLLCAQEVDDAKVEKKAEKSITDVKEKMQQAENVQKQAEEIQEARKEKIIKKEEIVIFRDFFFRKIGQTKTNNKSFCKEKNKMKLNL